MPRSAKSCPPLLAEKLLHRVLRDDLAEEVLGDLEEKFYATAERKSVWRAKLNYWYQTFNYLRPFAIKKSKRITNSDNLDMLSNYFKIGFRNLIRHKSYSVINIGGLALGMIVTMFIGLWIYDELTFDKNHENYDRIAQVWQRQTANETIFTGMGIPLPLGAELKATYGSDFEHIVLASWAGDHILTYGDKKLTKRGIYMDTEAPYLFSLKMLKGSRNALRETNTIILSASTAAALFGEEEPMNKLLRLNNEATVEVTGIFEDLPNNSKFHTITFIAPWSLYEATNKWVKMAREREVWDNNSFQLFAQLNPGLDFEQVNNKIKTAKYDKVTEEQKIYQAEIFLHPMKDWHLRTGWENGQLTGGLIQYVWLFGAIGLCVLLLACINFMNLSTARSERRAKEVGIRKSLGSVRSQLVQQFMSESFIVVTLAFMISLLVVLLVIPSFNNLTDKQVALPLGSWQFWAASLTFILFTGFVAGSYPALYLSSFHPVKVLKGTFRSGKSTTAFRRALVVLQFSVSVILITGAIGVEKQIAYSKDRPIGYEVDRTVMIKADLPDYKGKFEVLRSELVNSGAVVEMAESSSPLTEVWAGNAGFEWPGKDPSFQSDFGTITVTKSFGKTINWQIKEGRDFSDEMVTDEKALIVNEASVAYMGVKDPVGMPVKWGSANYRIIGVVKDMVVESPFGQTKQLLYHLGDQDLSWIVLKLNPAISSSSTLATVEGVFKKVVPAVPFDYQFTDREFAQKFAMEERIGKLSGIFAALAVLISCLGLLGLIAFVVEQRTKEIGIRKVLGASIFNLWKLLSREFLGLVVISCTIAIPISWYGISSWLQNYDYRTPLNWWIFAVAGMGALLITLGTVSFQTIKAAKMNPAKSLRSE
jgi:putative ABC transport system permease protein